MTGPLRLAVVADIHHGPDVRTKRGGAALPLLRRALDEIVAWRPDAVIDLGDRISDVDPEADRRHAAEVAALFESLGVPRFHLLGNHDVAHLSAADNAAVLGCPAGHASVIVGGWRLVLWQADTTYDRARGLRLAVGDLDWLQAELAGSAEPVVLFSHVPLGGGSMIGNPYFEAQTRLAAYETDAAAIRAALAGSGRVALCVAGHVHWNALHTLDGIPHVTVQSLTESFTTGEPSGCWASFEIADGTARWVSRGADGIAATLRLPPAARPRPVGWDPLDGASAMILDMDGLLYQGDAALDGAGDFLAELDDRGIPYLMLTNNARSTPEAYAVKLAGMGMTVAADRIITSAIVTADFLVCQGRPTARVFGPASLHAAIRDAGLPEAEHPDVVVAGIDYGMTIGELAEAVLLVNGGARLMITNPDLTIPRERGLEPSAGAVCAFLEAATGRVAETIGKPSRAIFDYACARLGVCGPSVLVVGDTPETDIAGARAAGLSSALVCTGNSARVGIDPVPYDPSIRPTVVAHSLDELASILWPP